MQDFCQQAYGAEVRSPECSSCLSALHLASFLMPHAALSQVSLPTPEKPSKCCNGAGVPLVHRVVENDTEYDICFSNTQIHMSMCLSLYVHICICTHIYMYVHVYVSQSKFPSLHTDSFPGAIMQQFIREGAGHGAMARLVVSRTNKSHDGTSWHIRARHAEWHMSRSCAAYHRHEPGPKQTWEFLKIRGTNIDPK